MHVREGMIDRWRGKWMNSSNRGSGLFQRGDSSWGSEDSVHMHDVYLLAKIVMVCFTFVEALGVSFQLTVFHFFELVHAQPHRVNLSSGPVCGIFPRPGTVSVMNSLGSVIPVMGMVQVSPSLTFKLLYRGHRCSIREK